MKFLTPFDHTNIFALLVSTLIVLAVQFMHWGSTALTVIMVILLAVVITASIINRKYRKMARNDEAIILTDRDLMLARGMMILTAILAVLAVILH